MDMRPTPPTVSDRWSESFSGPCEREVSALPQPSKTGGPRAVQAARPRAHVFFRQAIRRAISPVILASALVAAAAGAPAQAGAAAGAQFLQAQALGPWSASIKWQEPPGTDHLKLLRNGDLLDQFEAASGTAYEDHLLWPQTTYTYQLRAFDASGDLVASDQDSVTTPPPGGQDFPRPFADSSFWNQPIGPSAQVDPNSGGMIAESIVPYAADANLSKSDQWGIPVAYANPQNQIYRVLCLKFGCDTDVSFRLPVYTQNDGEVDAHLVVLDAGSSDEMDAWEATYDRPRDSWTAGSRYLTSSDGWGANCPQGDRCGGAVAAGFAALGGVVRPAEIAQGHIDHALALMIPYVRSGFIACPATNSDGEHSDPDAIPEGARLQLDPSFDVDAQSWPKWERVVARALQDYGAYVEDVGGTLAVRAESNLLRGYDAWALAGVGSTDLSDIPWSKVRVLRLQRC
jgi:hypothetical protein